MYLQTTQLAIMADFGLEIKNPDGTGLTTGDGSIVIEDNIVTFTPTGSMDRRDHAGIAVFRRSFQSGNPNGYVDVPTGVVLRNNTVTGYRQERTIPSPTLTSEGFGLAIEGNNHIITGNTLTDNDIGIQLQGGMHPYANYVFEDVGDGDQEDGMSPEYFGRGKCACCLWEYSHWKFFQWQCCGGPSRSYHFK